MELLMIFSGIILSSYCIYTDIKYGKIKNRINLLLIFIAIFGHFYLFVRGIEPLQTILLIFSEALLFGFLLYYFGLLSSGDTKLFWGLTFILPVSFFANSNKSFPIEGMIINIFIPMLIFLIVYILYKTPLQTKVKTFREAINLKFLIDHFIGFFAIIGSSIVILQYLHIPMNFLFTIFLVIVLLELIKKLSINNWLVYAVLLIFTLLNLDNLIYFFMLAFIVLFVRIGLEYFIVLSMGVFLKEININKLTLDMSPAEAVIYDGREYFKKLIKYSISPIDFGKYEKVILDPSFENITQEEIDMLKKLKKQRKLNFDSILIHQTIPFAPFVFLGFLLTILFKGSFIYYFFSIL